MAQDVVWAEFSDGWRHILRTHRPTAAYMHMNEAMSLDGEFRLCHGWDKYRRASLIRRLIGFLSENRWKGAIKPFSCTVDLDGHDRARREKYPVKRPHRLATFACVTQIFSGYAELVGKSRAAVHHVEKIDYLFDQNEGFLRHLHDLQDRYRGRQLRQPRPEDLFWSLLNRVAPVPMRQHPGVQAADMLAWSINRLLRHGDHADLCIGILDAIRGPGSATHPYVVFDYDNLTRPFRRIALPVSLLV